MTTAAREADDRDRYELGPAITAGICAILLGVFAAVSYNAVLSKSATWDEPEHLLGAYIHKFHGDYRINPEDPALFGHIAAVPLSRGDLKVDLESPSFQNILLDTGYQWPFIWLTLYRTGGNDPDVLLNQSRAMGTLVGVLLGATIAWWGYRLGGTPAAVTATVLFAFCPNFLAHSSLVKNDVMLSAAVLGLMFALWRFGRRGTVFNLAAAALLAGAAISVKYSGVMAAPFVVIALVVRALLPQDWPILGMNLATRLNRVIAAMVATAIIGLVAYAFVWAAYGFRFAPTPDPELRLNVDQVIAQAKSNEILADRVRAEMARREESMADVLVAVPTPEELESHTPSAVVRLSAWMNERRLLPHAWLYGFVYTYKSTLIRSAYLLGDIRITGWWYFFPVAMLVKTPLATLTAASLALLVAALRFAHRRPWPERFVEPWAFACLLVAPAIYGTSAMTTNLNLGLRHVLPLYPFIFIGTAIVLAAIFKRWSYLGKGIAGVIVLGLVIETVTAYPHYIAFFNAPAGGSRGGFRLLGDSNLDWGQDLKLLAEWQREHPDTPLYLSYFGMADPAYYGISATHLPGGYQFAQQQNPSPGATGVFAISATNLQGVYINPPELRETYREIARRPPRQILGGSIYLFDYPLPPARGPDTPD